MLQLFTLCTFIFLGKKIVSPEILSFRSLNLSFSNVLQDMVLGLVLFSLQTFWFNFGVVKSNLLKFSGVDVSIVGETLKEPGWKFGFFEARPFSYLVVSTLQLTMCFL